MMDWYSIYIVDKKIFIFANVAFSQFLTLEIAYSEKLRRMGLLRNDDIETEFFLSA